MPRARDSDQNDKAGKEGEIPGSVAVVWKEQGKTLPLSHTNLPQSTTFGQVRAEDSRRPQSTPVACRTTMSHRLRPSQNGRVIPSPLDAPSSLVHSTDIDGASGASPSGLVLEVMMTGMQDQRQPTSRPIRRPITASIATEASMEVVMTSMLRTTSFSERLVAMSSCRPLSYM